MKIQYHDGNAEARLEYREGRVVARHEGTLTDWRDIRRHPSARLLGKEIGCDVWEIEIGEVTSLRLVRQEGEGVIHDHV